MRSVFLVIIALVLLVGGFLVYYAIQGTGARPRPENPRLAATTLPAELPDIAGDSTAQVAGPGTDVWIQTFDEKTNRVAFQFRASRYDPQPEGPVDVTNPQAELFTGSRADERQVIRIEGKTGRVVMPTSAAQRATIGGGADSSAPQRGELHDVTISLFDESDLSRPLLVCRVNNIAFDNDTYRIATEAYQDGTRDVPADEVRVEVRGEDFDFDGRGLTIRWNEADRRLQLLEIAHGERLVIKSPEMLRAFDRGGSPQERASLPGKRDADQAAGRSADAVLASAQDTPPEAGEAGGAGKADGAGEPRAGASALPPVYRASFRDEVRITRAEEMLASADQMLVDFISDEQEPISTPGTPRRRPDRAGATLAPPKPSAPDRTPADRPDAAAEQGALQPVVVHWLGKLRVTALEGETPRPAPGSINVVMSSEETPVVLNHRGLDVRCASFDYRSGDDSLAITSSKAVPIIELKLADGTVVSTPSIVYRGGESQAVLRGQSTASIPLPDENGGPPQMLKATWTDTCILTLSPVEGATNAASAGAGAGLRAERAVFKGDVNIDHPQLALRSDSLDLAFDPNTDQEQPAPSQVTAAGAVRCRLVDSSGNWQLIHCDELLATVAPADEKGAKPSPRTFTAEGNVVATNEDAELMAGHLTIAMVPARQPADPQKPADAAAKPSVWGGGEFEVESITAQQDVKLSLRDGGGATADQIHMTLTPEGTRARLLGQPATLSDGESTLSGPHITYEQSAQKLAVQGPGSVSFALRDAPQDPARPVQVAWQTGLEYDGVNNSAEIAGSATVATNGADGSKQSASGDRILITLEDAPQPRPAAAGAPAAEPAAAQAAARAAAGEPGRVDDAPRAGAMDHLGLAGNKTLRLVTLAGNAQVQSVLHAEEDAVRRMHLLAPQVKYDVPRQRLEVPSAGRMLVQDTLPARSPDAQPERNRLLGDFRGATAFQWSESLVFDQSEGHMTMAGSVLIVHEDPQRSDHAFRLEAARVDAELLPGEEKPRDGAAASPLLGSSELHLKTLSAFGEIRLSSPQIQLDAHEVFYDASTELLTARGNERVPVELHREPGISRGSFGEVIWNVRTEQIHLRDIQGKLRR